MVNFEGVLFLKGSVRPSGGHAVALKWTLKHMYNISAGDVSYCFFCQDSYEAATSQCDTYLILI